MLIPCDEVNILNTFRVMINNDNFKTAVTSKKDWKHIERCIFNYAETTRSDSDYYVGNTVRELCLTRSADFILDTAELNLLIHHLCTS